MAEAKERSETASFEDVLKEIDVSAEELSRASDALRIKVRTLCGFVEYITDRSDKPVKANELVAKLRKEGWQVIETDKNVVRGVGIIVKRLKRAGVEFCSSKNLDSETVDYGRYTIWTLNLCFGKLHGDWQFYCRSWNADDEETTDISLENAKREYLPKILEQLPTFLQEYAMHLKKTKVELDNDCKKAGELGKQFVDDAKA